MKARITVDFNIKCGEHVPNENILNAIKYEIDCHLGDDYEMCVENDEGREELVMISVAGNCFETMKGNIIKE